MAQNNKIIERRLTSLEITTKNIKEDIVDIKDNHLKGIYGKLGEIEKKIYQRPSWLMAGVLSLLTGLIIYLLTR